MLDSLASFDASHRVYKNPPLVMSLCQVRFASVLSVSDEAFVAPFQNAIRREFPLADRPVEIQVALDMRPGGFQPPVTQQKWRFADVSGTWAVVLAQDFIALETREYSDFDHFMERLSFVLNALVKHIQPDPGLRIGLRYIDEIRLADADPRSAIRPELLGAMTQEEVFSKAVRSVQEIALQYPEGEAVTLRHGYFSSGTTVQPPAPESAPLGPFYLLDTDVYREFTPPAVLQMDTDSICQHVEEYHQAVYRLFRWALTDEYAASLEKGV